MHLSDPSSQIASARPEATAAIVAGTGLDEDILNDLVRTFYSKVRRDALLGPIFAVRISDWKRHLDRMVAFWSSVALMTGRYHGRPVPAHAPLPLDGTHFERWLTLFSETAHEVCAPAGAAHLIERAKRIARSLQYAVMEAQATGGADLTSR